MRLNLKIFYRCLNWFQSHIQSGRIHHHLTLKAESLKWLLMWEQWAGCTFQGQGRGGEPLIILIHLSGQRQSCPFDDCLPQLCFTFEVER